MKRFIVYDKDTKQLLREGQCPDSVFEAQAQNSNEVVCEHHQVIKRTYVTLVEELKRPRTTTPEALEKEGA